MLTKNDRTDRAVLGGVVAGIVGGVVIELFLLAGALSRGVDLWMMLKGAGGPFLGARAHQPGFDLFAILAGQAVHFAISIGWALLFTVFAYGMSKPLTLLFGAFWGIVVWLGMYDVVLPLAGMGDVAKHVPVGMAILNHVIFGLAVAIGLLPYQVRHRPLLARHA